MVNDHVIVILLTIINSETSQHHGALGSGDPSGLTAGWVPGGVVNWLGLNANHVITGKHLVARLIGNMMSRGGW